MNSKRLLICAALLVLAPAPLLAQAGVTPLLASPFGTDRGQNEFAGYFSIEEEIDLFGTWRHGLGNRFDAGARAGFTGVADGGFHFGGDLRYAFPNNNPESMPLNFAIVGGLQFSFFDGGNIIAVPFGVSLGADVGQPERPIVLYGIPRLMLERFDVSGFTDTEFEFGVELGSEIFIANGLYGEANLTIASNTNDHVALALGLSYQR